MFSVADRDRVRDRTLAIAAADTRVVAGAVLGSLAHSDGDRWSDLDLMFGVADDTPVADVLADWTQTLVREFGAIRLFDLPVGATIYRVFLLPGSLQFDLSFAPASQFAAGGPNFKLLFGEAVERAWPTAPPPQELFGLGVHHALRARFCIERGRYWQAEYWISGARDLALNLACRRRDLSTFHGRGFDELPPDLLVHLQAALVRSLEPGELLRALRATIDALRGESADAGALAVEIEPQLRELTSEWV